MDHLPCSVKLKLGSSRGDHFIQVLECIVAMHVKAVSHNHIDSSNHAANNMMYCTDASNLSLSMLVELTVAIHVMHKNIFL